MTTPQSQQLRLGEALLDSGYLTEEQLKTALSMQKASSERKRLGEVLIESGIITEDRLNMALSTRLGVKYVPISECPIDLNAVALIPRSVAKKHCLIAIYAERNTLRILINDPLNYYALEDVKLI